MRIMSRSRERPLLGSYGAVGFLAMTLPLAGCGSLPRGPAFDAGCLASRDRDLEGAYRLRVAGPLVEARQRADGATFVAVRPFYSRSESPVEDRRREEFLWPVGLRKEALGSAYWQVLTAFGHDFDTEDSDSRYRAAVLPLLFWGRDRHGERYGAVFPLGGTLHEFLWQDQIRFVLFPLYAETLTRGTRTRHILWPVVAWSEGGRVRRHRVFPLYGHVTHEGRFEKRFVLWPIWTSADYQWSDNPGHAWLLFPLAGHVAQSNQTSWMLIPPLFRWSRNEAGVREVRCPWPFIQYASGPVDQLYLWPLWGRKRSGPVRRTFYLWPIGSSETIEQQDATVERWRLFPLLSSEVRREPSVAERAGESRSPPRADTALPAAPRPEETRLAGPSSPTRAAKSSEPPEAKARYFQLWPLVDYERQGDHARWRTLSLWPSRGMAPVERNWAPWWTVYRRERKGVTSEQELLWGLFRRRTAPEDTATSVFPLASWASSPSGRAVSVLGGLVGFRRDDWQRTWRLLYWIRFSHVTSRDSHGGTGPREPESVREVKTADVFPNSER